VKKFHTVTEQDFVPDPWKRTVSEQEATFPIIM